MEEMYNKPGVTEFLTPREVIRDFLNILNILRQNPEADKKKLIADIRIKDERDPYGTDRAVNSRDDQTFIRKKKIEKQCRNLILPDEVAENLSTTLLEDENVLKAMPASIRNQAGTLVATEKRLLFMDRNLKNTSFPYSRINGMTYTHGSQHSTLHMKLDHENLDIEFLPKNQVKPLINLLEAQIDILERKTLSAEIKYWEKQIRDPKMKAVLTRMSKIAFIIQEKDRQTGEIFSMRHADTVVKLLKQYYTIEWSDMHSQDIIDSLSHITDAINMTHEAFEQELKNIFKTDMLDIEAEAAAYKQSLQNRGLIN